MSLKTINGDLLKLTSEGYFDYIMHGCNCFCTMGAGIALQIKNKFPEAYIVDKKTVLGSIMKLGSYTFAFNKESCTTIINLYTQHAPGNNFELSALDLSLRKFVHNNQLTTHRIGLPYIGAGIGGGNWDDIYKVIEKHLGKYNTTIVNYKK
jgi:O-acetyl-ADP-ribose deacetylase (regulator of RNase III)